VDREEEEEGGERKAKFDGGLALYIYTVTPFRPIFNPIYSTLLRRRKDFFYFQKEICYYAKKIFDGNQSQHIIQNN
jgi:hypothetical protein